MAKIECKAGNLLINLILYPDPKSYDWVAYKIIIGPRSGNKDLSLVLSGSELYFEACYEQEVIGLCYGIKEVLAGKVPIFFFEPVDQEDFQFMIRKTGDDTFMISIHSDKFLIPKDYNCPAYLDKGVSVAFTKEEILSFVEQLEGEYKKVIDGYPKDPNCCRKK